MLAQTPAKGCEIVADMNAKARSRHFPMGGQRDKDCREEEKGEWERMKRRYVLVMVALCGLTMVSLGLVLKLAGLFFTPVADEFGCGRGEASLALTVVNLASALAGLAAARLVRRMRLRVLVAAGAACTVGGTALLSLAQGLPMLYLLSAVQGFGAGLIGSVLVTDVVGEWFVRRRALAVSVAFGSSGIAGAVFSPLVSRVIQGVGWRAGYLASALIMLVLCLPALLAPVARTPGELGLAPYGAAAREKRAACGTPDGSVGESVTSVDVDADEGADKSADKEAAPSASARLAAVLYFAFATTMVTAVPHHFPGMAGAYGLAASVGALMISVCMVVNTCGKFALGWAIGRFGLRTAAVADVAMVAGGLALLAAVRTAPGVYVAAALVGCAYSAVTVLLSTLVRALYGDEGYGRVFPKANLASTLGTAVGAPFIGFVFDLTGGYAKALIVLAVLVLAGLVTVLRLPRRAD